METGRTFLQGKPGRRAGTHPMTGLKPGCKSHAARAKLESGVTKQQSQRESNKICVRQAVHTDCCRVLRGLQNRITSMQVERMALQCLERYQLQHFGIGRFEHDPRRLPGFPRFYPT